MDRTAFACAASVMVHVMAALALLGLPVSAERRTVALPMAVRAAEGPATAAATMADVGTKSAPKVEQTKTKAKAKAKTKAKTEPSARVPAAGSVAVPVPEATAVTESASESGKPVEDGDGHGQGYGNGNGNENGDGHGDGHDSDSGRRATLPVTNPPHPPEPSEDYTRLVPPYSDAAIDSDVNGAVSLRLEIDETGRVVHATVLRGLGHGLDQIAVTTALKYRFHPARDAAGNPVRTVIGWNIVWESYWKRLVVQTIAGHPNCRGHGPMNLGEIHPEYIDCDHPAGEFPLEPDDPPRP